MQKSLRKMSVNAVNRVAVVAKVVAKQGGVNTSPSLIL